MPTAKVFQTGRSQAIRLPKEFRFGVDEVEIRRMGEAVILYPRNRRWALLDSAYGAASTGFLSDRRQPGREERRKGL